MGPSVLFISYENQLNHGVQLQNCSKEAVTGSQYYGDRPWRSYSTKELMVQVNQARGSEEEAEQAPPPAWLWGRGSSCRLSALLGHDSGITLTSLKATNPAQTEGKPGSGKQQSLTQMTTLLSLTPHSLGWGRKGSRTQRRVLAWSALSPTDDQVSGEAFHFNISKRHCSFFRSLCHVHKINQ